MVSKDLLRSWEAGDRPSRWAALYGGLPLVFLAVAGVTALQMQRRGELGTGALPELFGLALDGLVFLVLIEGYERRRKAADRNQAEEALRLILHGQVNDLLDWLSDGALTDHSLVSRIETVRARVASSHPPEEPDEAAERELADLLASSLATLRALTPLAYQLSPATLYDLTQIVTQFELGVGAGPSEERISRFAAGLTAARDLVQRLGVDRVRAHEREYVRLYGPRDDDRTA
jgi:hypothetical protein